MEEIKDGIICLASGIQLKAEEISEAKVRLLDILGGAFLFGVCVTLTVAFIFGVGC